MWRPPQRLVTTRARVGYNAAGWRIWPTNYGMYLSQVKPQETSIGRWHIGEPSADGELLGHGARSTQLATGKTNMSFALDPAVFRAGNASSSMYLRVCALDEGKGTWTLGASSGAGQSKVLATVKKRDTRRWVEVRTSVALGDLDVATSSLLLHLADAGAVDDHTFAWLEASKQPFLFNITETVISM